MMAIILGNIILAMLIRQQTQKYYLEQELALLNTTKPLQPIKTIIIHIQKYQINITGTPLHIEFYPLQSTPKYIPIHITQYTPPSIPLLLQQNAPTSEGTYSVVNLFENAVYSVVKKLEPFYDKVWNVITGINK